jgi:hypothetical protein
MLGDFTALQAQAIPSISNAEQLRTSLNNQRQESSPLYGTVMVLYDADNVFESSPRTFASTLVQPRLDGKGLASALILLTQAGSARSDETFVATLTHELGHSLGLGHSVVHDGGQLRLDKWRTLTTAPLLFPFMPDSSPTALHLNDRAWGSVLYGGQQIPDPFAALAGVLLDSEGKPIDGANIVAVGSRADGEPFDSAGSLRYRFSCLSGTFGKAGTFLIPFVPGRAYVLYAESLLPANELSSDATFHGFSGTSHVGPLVTTLGGGPFVPIRPTEGPRITWQAVRLFAADGKEFAQWPMVRVGETVTVTLRLPR